MEQSLTKFQIKTKYENEHEINTDASAAAAFVFAIVFTVVATLATAAERRVSNFKTQNVANTAWAFAQASQ